MVRELERVERELRERDRAELAALREQVAALAAAQVQPPPSVSTTQQHSAADKCAPSTNRVPNRISLSIALNVAALCAAIAIGAMQLLDNGARPHFLFKLCVLMCGLSAVLLPSNLLSLRPQGNARWCGRASSVPRAQKHQTFRTLAVLLLLVGDHRSSRTFDHHRAGRVMTIDFALRQRPRSPPSSAFALAASDIESHAC
eukprot:2993597-Pleurochrysis_carterae.AAC.1